MNYRIFIITGAVALAGVSRAQVMEYTSSLDGLQEVPSVTTPGVGMGSLTINTTTFAYSGFVRWRNRNGTPSDAHIHVGGPTQTGGVIYGFGVAGTTTESFGGFTWTRKEFSGTLVNKTVSNPAALAGTYTPTQQIEQFFNTGTTYFNVHTSTNASGEIRGRITVVPEPATLAMLGFGALAMLRRRKA